MQTKSKDKFKKTLDLHNPDKSLEVVDKEEVTELEDISDLGDGNFEAELNYEGYGTIEESDNNVYGSRNLEKKDRPGHELIVADRSENAEAGEEDLVDPQENRK